MYKRQAQNLNGTAEHSQEEKDDNSFSNPNAADPLTTTEAAEQGADMTDHEGKPSSATEDAPPVESSVPISDHVAENDGDAQPPSLNQADELENTEGIANDSVGVSPGITNIGAASVDCQSQEKDQGDPASQSSKQLPATTSSSPDSENIESVDCENEKQDQGQPDSQSLEQTPAITSLSPDSGCNKLVDHGNEKKDQEQPDVHSVEQHPAIKSESPDSENNELVDHESEKKDQEQPDPQSLEQPPATSSSSPDTENIESVDHESEKKDQEQPDVHSLEHHQGISSSSPDSENNESVIGESEEKDQEQPDSQSVVQPPAPSSSSPDSEDKELVNGDSKMTDPEQLESPSWEQIPATTSSNPGSESKESIVRMSEDQSLDQQHPHEQTAAITSPSPDSETNESVDHKSDDQGQDEQQLESQAPGQLLAMTSPPPNSENNEPVGWKSNEQDQQELDSQSSEQRASTTLTMIPDDENNESAPPSKQQLPSSNDAVQDEVPSPNETASNAEEEGVREPLVDLPNVSLAESVQSSEYSDKVEDAAKKNVPDERNDENIQKAVSPSEGDADLGCGGILNQQEGNSSVAITEQPASQTGPEDCRDSQSKDPTVLDEALSSGSLNRDHVHETCLLYTSDAADE